jgi:hypothetical protein
MVAAQIVIVGQALHGVEHRGAGQRAQRGAVRARLGASAGGGGQREGLEGQRGGEGQS